jgi:hypothetical protein
MEENLIEQTYCQLILLTRWWTSTCPDWHPDQQVEETEKATTPYMELFVPTCNLEMGEMVCQINEDVAKVIATLEKHINSYGVQKVHSDVVNLYKEPRKEACTKEEVAEIVTTHKKPDSGCNVQKVHRDMVKVHKEPRIGYFVKEGVANEVAWQKLEYTVLTCKLGPGEVVWKTIGLPADIARQMLTSQI